MNEYLEFDLEALGILHEYAIIKIFPFEKFIIVLGVYCDIYNFQNLERRMLPKFRN
jgi:hypothetical protein